MADFTGSTSSENLEGLTALEPGGLYYLGLVALTLVFCFQDYADDTIAFLRHCVAEPAHLFGCSLGGEIALMVAAQCPECVRAVAVGDSPLTREHDIFGPHDPHRARVAAWRDMAGGRLSIDQLIEALKDAPTEIPGQAEPVTMREKYGEEDGVYSWVASNLYHNDPDMLTALLDDHEATTAGYDMDQLLPAIGCPVLLLQADPDAGGIMTDAEVAHALPLLAKPTHVRLDGIGHGLFLDHKELVLRQLKSFFDAS